jgi:hypothetical protein
MAPDVAGALTQLGRRDLWLGEDDLVFVGETGSYLDGSALRRRYKETLGRGDQRDPRHNAKAGLRALGCAASLGR